MNFINLLRTLRNKMNNGIRRDDLDALGGMVNMLGLEMRDIMDKTNNDSRSNLFKTAVNPKQIIHKALQNEGQEDIAIKIIPDNCPMPQGAPPINIQPSPQPINNFPVKEVDGPSSKQLELGLNLDSMIPKEYKSVTEIMKHFNERLDNLENQFFIIRSILTEIRTNTAKKRKVKNESKKIT